VEAQLSLCLMHQLSRGPAAGCNVRAYRGVGVGCKLDFMSQRLPATRWHGCCRSAYWGCVTPLQDCCCSAVGAGLAAHAAGLNAAMAERKRSCRARRLLI
jgi:hypothetical protein